MNTIDRLLLNCAPIKRNPQYSWHCFAFASLLMTAQCVFAICENTWDGERLKANFANLASSTQVKLVVPKTSQTFLLNWGQFRVFTDAVERINTKAQLDPQLIFCSDKQPNAFAAPTSKGNIVAITLGMVQFANGDPDLAAYIVGHEIAHHMRKHGQSKLTRNTALEIASLIVGSIAAKRIGDKGYSPQIAYDVASIGTGLVSAKFDRDQEREADELGFQYMVIAGFNPRGAQRATRKFTEGKLGGNGTFFDTHPSWDERSERIERLISQSPIAQQIIAKGDYSPQPSGTISSGVIELSANALSLERLNLVAQAEVMVAAQLAQGKVDSPEVRDFVTNELLRRAVLRKEAVKIGLDKSPDVQAKIDLARQGVLIGAYLNRFVRAHPVTEDQITKEYEDIKAKLGNREYKVRHILVESEGQAKAIIEKLKTNENFAQLAKQSKDPGSKDRGGDLGWANQAAFVAPFSAAMTKLEKGKFTDAPVKTDFGWHVIQVEDIRELKLPTLDEAKDKIRQQLGQRMVQQHIESLLAKATVQKFAYPRSPLSEKRGTEVLATVNGKAILVRNADSLLADQVREGRTESEELRNLVREELVRREVIQQEAIKEGVDNDPSIKTQGQIADEGTLVVAYLTEYRRTHPATDKDQQEQLVQKHIAELRARFEVE